MTAADIGNLDNINEAYKTSIKLVKTIDDYILKEEFGLTEETVNIIYINLIEVMKILIYKDQI